MPPDTFMPADLRRQLVQALTDITESRTCLDLESEISRLLGEVGGIWPDYCRPVRPRFHRPAHGLMAPRALRTSGVISLANAKAA